LTSFWGFDKLNSVPMGNGSSNGAVRAVDLQGGAKSYEALERVHRPNFLGQTPRFVFLTSLKFLEIESRTNVRDEIPNIPEG
jgi:hypothetical protein